MTLLRRSFISEARGLKGRRSCSMMPKHAEHVQVIPDEQSGCSEVNYKVVLECALKLNEKSIL